MERDKPPVPGSAKVLALCTLLSRLTGMVRDIFLNAALGQTWVQDAWTYGFQIPNLFRRLFGEGALAAVFVPVFTETLDRDGKPAAAELAGRVAALIVLLLSGLTLLIELVVGVLWFALPDEPMRRLMFSLTAIMAPFMVSICTLALFSSVLYCLNHFTVPALAPIILNVFNIIGTLFVGPLLSDRPEVQVFGIAASVLVAAVVQILIVLPVARRHGVPPRLIPRFDDPRLREMVRHFLPVVIGQGVLLINVFLDSQLCILFTRMPDGPETFAVAGRTIAYPLTDGALAAVANAQRLYQFPLGVLAISLATAAFPALARFAARGETDNLRRATSGALRMAIFEGLPAGVMMLLFAEPIVAMLFQHGRFDAVATRRAATVLNAYGIGMAAFCAQHIVTRGFYALKDTRTPMRIGCALVLLNQLLNVALIWHPRIRESAFGLSTSITSTMFVLIGLWKLRVQMGGRIDGRAIVAGLLRAFVASCVAGAAALAVSRFAVGRLAADGSLAARAVACLLPLGVAVVAYVGAAKLLRMEELDWLLSRRRKV